MSQGRRPDDRGASRGGRWHAAVARIRARAGRRIGPLLRFGRWTPLVVSLLLAAGVRATLAIAGTGRPPVVVSRTAAATSGTRTATSRAGSGAAGARSRARRPNIVFVLTDDLSMDLLPYMPQVEALARHGMTFENYFVSDSLCCPSRSSIFTGLFPHNSGVYSNVGPNGGIRAFYRHDDERRAFNVALQRAGYQTAMMGKYLNGYLQRRESPVPNRYIPPGWNEWDVAGWGYPEFDYTLNQNGRLHRYGHRADDYMTSVLTGLADRFIRREAGKRRPFFLEVATFAPHRPYTPAPRYAHAFTRVTAPTPPNFNLLPVNPPNWLSGHAPLTAAQIARLDDVFRARIQAVQSIDNLIASIERTLRTHGLLGRTYIVFSSDNGLHTGEYRLMPGKLTAYDTDIHVPLVVAGPGVPPASSTRAMAENVDIAATFTSIAGIPFSSDGESLLPFLQGRHPPDWRNAVLVEHQGRDIAPNDPDKQSFDSGNPTTYEAMRTPDFLYVEYADGEREFYDLRTDPFELDNLAPQLTPDARAVLHAELRALEQCRGTGCQSPSRIPLRQFRVPPIRRH